MSTVWQRLAIVCTLVAGACAEPPLKKIAGGWHLDDVPAGQTSPRLYYVKDGTRVVVDRQVRRTVATTCLLYESARPAAASVIFAAHAGKTPIAVATSDALHTWRMTSAGLRRFEPPQTDENGVTTLSYEYLDSLYICSAAWSQPPLDTNWAGGPLTLAKIKTERTTLQVNGVDSVGNSTLDEQLRERRPDIVDELVRAGADVNGANRYGYTSLMTAVVYDQDGTTMVQRLLDAGADVDVQDKSGTTALMVATRYNRKEAAALLLARGADPTIRDNQGRTAAAMTRDWDPTLNTVLEEAAKRRR